MNTTQAFMIGFAVAFLGSSFGWKLWQEMKFTAKVCGKVRGWYTAQYQHFQGAHAIVKEKLWQADLQLHRNRDQVHELGQIIRRLLERPAACEHLTSEEVKRIKSFFPTASAK